jgi:uncharacterized protein YbaR (Trm112 family)
MKLLCEVQGCCPLCRNELVVKKKKKIVRIFDVAHIYPLNATAHENKILSGEETLSTDIDCEENFIALCKVCHKIYDTQKTVEEYRQLVQIKKNINRIRSLSESWDRQSLHKDISVVAERIGSLSEDEIKGTKLTYDALKLSEKKDDSLGLMNEIKVSQFIINFFVPIREALNLLEVQEKAKSEFICSQVRSYYILLYMNNFNQSQIFEMLCDWFIKNTGIADRVKAEVLVSFFIQNCEVYSNASSK